MSMKLPSVDSVTTINRDGSRYFLHPSDVTGRFTFLRKAFAITLLAIYVLLPWIKINGFPAVFLDVADRRLHLFGFTFAPQDFWLGFFVISGVGFSLFYITALFGRLWCGWACPFTVFLENVYRRIERLVDGDAHARRALDAAPPSSEKTAKRVIKHTLFLLASTLIAHIFLSYFVSLPRLWDMMLTRPTENLVTFGVVVFLTLVLYGAFSWFREQFCIILCPYGRIQSALTDDNTMVIGYDAKRGEPRGKANTPGVGDCINCLRCVQVCPTGIDIRNGLQLECVGCAACVDACDAVMAKLHRPKGLVRYASMNELGGKKTRWIRPRIIAYTILLAIGATVMSVSLTRLKPFQLTFARMPGLPYYLGEGHSSVRNQFQVRLFNKQMHPLAFTLELVGAPEGTKLSGPEANLTLAPQEERIVAAMIEVPRSAYHGKQNMTLRITSQPDHGVMDKRFEFVGPDPKLLDPTTPQQ